MVQYVRAPVKTFTAGAALAQYRRVRLSAGVLAYAGASDTDALGEMAVDSFASGDVVGVTLHNAQGTKIMVASAAISAGAGVYAAADGKIASSGTVLVGLALEAAGTNGDLIEVSPSAATTTATFARSALTQDDLKPYTIPLEAFRTWDARQTTLPGTAGTDDLGLITGTYGTNAPRVQTSDGKNTTTTQRLAFQLAVPAEYVDGESITIRIRAGMVTTVASNSGATTVDVEASKVGADGTVGADICATAAQTINSLTAADKDFVITPTGVVAGDLLDVRVTIVVTDVATATAVIGQINKVQALFDVKG